MQGTPAVHELIGQTISEATESNLNKFSFCTYLSGGLSEASKCLRLLRGTVLDALL